ncbi:hypothetical protein [Cystobacter fuscus]|uniref:hypothetical protein n=1 Tax=Cystobacter fuscus TaxID=43 RepID=UPI0037BFE5DA
MDQFVTLMTALLSSSNTSVLTALALAVVLVAPMGAWNRWWEKVGRPSRRRREK